MRRTLLAIGSALLASLMFVPHVLHNGEMKFLPFYKQQWSDNISWGHLFLQTVFICVLAAMIVNLPGDGNWEIIADKLSKAGWSLGWVSAVDSSGRTIGCSGSDKTVQNLTDCADKTRRGAMCGKNSLIAGVSLRRASFHW